MATGVIEHQKEYTIRRSQISTKNSLEVTFPYDVAKAKANSLGMTVREFIAKFNVIAQFGSSEGVRYTFTKKSDKKNAADSG